LAEGASERGEVDEQGAGLKRDADVRTWPENVWSWAHPRRGIVGRRLGMIDRWARRYRERGRARGKGTAPIDWPHIAARGREGVSAQVGADRRGPHVRHRGHAGAGALGIGSAWAKWAEMAFSISREFLMPFLFIFSRVFNSNSNQVSNSNQNKHVQQFKE
jgi:hypothetical protein